MARIAVVDDEKNIREVLRIALEKEFHTVVQYGDGLAAWEGFQNALPDCAILDITMPRMDGIELCRKIRALPGGNKLPLIFLSSRDEEIDRVLGLESGADDYVCKPFSLRELSARIKAALRRTQALNDEAAFRGGGQGSAAVIGAGHARTGGGQNDDEQRQDDARAAADADAANLTLDEDRYRALWNGAALDLTVTEFRILQNLCANPGFIKTREQLMAAAFPEDNYPNDRAADSHIKRIRKKFLDVDENFDRLEAVYGLGYKWKEV